MSKNNYYEVVFIIKQSSSSGHVESLANEFVSLIESNGGSVTKTELCGLRSLAYPIKKNTKGHYVLLNVSCSVDCIKEFERKINISEDVIRYLVIKVEKLDSNPSALIRRASGKDYV